MEIKDGRIGEVAPCGANVSSVRFTLRAAEG